LVNLDLLTSLDGLLWLQSGKQVGERFRQHQTTVSRNQKKCAQAFGFSIRKQKGFWAIDGDTSLLRLEREVHQLARFMGQASLRLEANGWLDGALCTPKPEGWIVGSGKPLGIARGLQLVEERIVDALLCPLADQPKDHPLLSTQPLCAMPLRPMVKPGHPLLQLSTISLDQVKAYPWQAIKRGAYPNTQLQLEAEELWPPSRRSQKLDEQLWRGSSENDVLIHIGSALSHSPDQPGLIPLPLSHAAWSGIALVMRHEHADRPAIEGLKEELCRRLQGQQSHHPDLQLLL